MDLLHRAPAPVRRTRARERLSVCGVEPESEFLDDLAGHCKRRARGGHVAWRLPLEHTDIEGHEIESSRQIIATSFRVNRRDAERLESTRQVHATCCRWELRTSCDVGGDQGRSDERLSVCGSGRRRAACPPRAPQRSDYSDVSERHDARDDVALHLDVQLLLQLAHVGARRSGRGARSRAPRGTVPWRCANSAGVTSSFSTTFTITVPRSVTIGSLTLPAGSREGHLVHLAG